MLDIEFCFGKLLLFSKFNNMISIILMYTAINKYNIYIFQYIIYKFSIFKYLILYTFFKHSILYKFIIFSFVLRQLGRKIRNYQIFVL